MRFSLILILSLLSSDKLVIAPKKLPEMALQKHNIMISIPMFTAWYLYIIII